MMQDNKFSSRAKKRLLVLAGLFLLVGLFLSMTVSASRFTDALSRTGGTLSGWFTSETPGTFDFVLFGIMFFALCWIGFQKWFEGAKGASIALSVTLAIALSAALVFGGKIGVRKLLPFASLLLFLLVVVAIAFILQKLVFKSDTALSKILTFVVAMILAALVMGFTLSALCEGESCEKNPFVSNLVGKASLFGKIADWFNDRFEGPSIQTPPRPVVPGAQPQKVIDEKLYTEASAWEKAQRTETDPLKVKDDLERANKAQEYINRLTK